MALTIKVGCVYLLIITTDQSEAFRKSSILFKKDKNLVNVKFDLLEFEHSELKLCHMDSLRTEINWYLLIYLFLLEAFFVFSSLTSTFLLDIMTPWLLGSYTFTDSTCFTLLNSFQDM